MLGFRFRSSSVTPGLRLLGGLTSHAPFSRDGRPRRLSTRALGRAGALVVAILWMGILFLALPQVAWADAQAPAVPPAITFSLVALGVLAVVSLIISALTAWSVSRLTARVAETREGYATKADLEIRNQALEGWMRRMDVKVDEMRDEQAAIRRLLE